MDYETLTPRQKDHLNKLVLDVAEYQAKQLNQEGTETQFEYLNGLEWSDKQILRSINV